MPTKKKNTNLNLQFLITNRRYLVLSVLSGLISVFILFSGIVPRINELQTLRQDLQDGQDKLNLLRQKMTDFENIEAREAYSSLDTVNKILPSKKPLLELLASLNQMANKNRVSFLDLSLSPGEIASQSADFLNDAKKSNKKSQKTSPNSGKGYDTMNIELEISGLFSDVQEFFIDLERMAPLTTISSLSLDVKTDDIIQDSDQVQAKLVLVTYFFTQSITAKLDSPLPDIGKKERDIITEIEGYSLPQAYNQTQIEGGGFSDPFGLLQDLQRQQ